jgi:hypothetical protein
MFLLRLIQNSRSNAAIAMSRTPRLNFSTAFFCVAGLVSVAATPYTLSNNFSFIVNLAFMHVILLLPLLNRSKRDGIWHSASWAVFFGIMALLGLVIRVSTIKDVLSFVSISIPGLLTLIRAIASNWCQLSISGDEIFCSILTIICMPAVSSFCFSSRLTCSVLCRQICWRVNIRSTSVDSSASEILDCSSYCYHF